MSLRQRIELARTVGPGWLLWRAGYALRKRAGLLKRRFPALSLERVEWGALLCAGVPTAPDPYCAFRRTHAPRFLFPTGQLPDVPLLEHVVLPGGRDRIIAVAEDYCRGRLLCYSHHRADVGGPVDWLKNPFTGARHPVRLHWCDYPTFSAAAGDIKDTWEPSRFACAFWLVRAYALTRDDRYAQAFWELFESWSCHNPPNMGPNWKCGQEAALRSMAWCFALYGFWNSPASRADRIVSLVKMLAIHAHRITGNIEYAVSQKNNHGISEAVGLLTIGLLFPELNDAPRWEALGRRVLEREVRRQIYDDGSYVQHSMNYHRMMLDDCIWAVRLADLNGRPLSSGLKARVARAGEFVLQVLDATSGTVPNYGANDGAMVLPLTPCEHRDYRPTAQAAAYLSTGKLVLPDGPWNEALVWLFGLDALGAPRTHVPRVSRRFDAGGYYTIRGAHTWCMIRCHTYRDRPGHVDMLHVDLWYDGVNVLGDSGTYRYYVPDDPAFERYFKDIGAHNTIELDGIGPLDLASRFLWQPWPRARCLLHTHDAWEGEHYAYDRSPWRVVHRRDVRLVDAEHWLIGDTLIGTGRHSVCLRWHLPDAPHRLHVDRQVLEMDLPCGHVVVHVQGPPGLRLEVCAGLRDGRRVSGWVSEYYGECRRRPTLEVRADLVLPVEILTDLRLSSR